MIIVQDTFVCKPGNASKVAKMFKATMEKGPGFVNVMTDMTGQYHRVIMVSQHESLAAFEKMMEDMAKNPSPEAKAKMEAMKGFQDMYVSGSREIFRVW